MTKLKELSSFLMGVPLVWGLAIGCSSVPIAADTNASQPPTKASADMNRPIRVPVPLIEHRLPPEQILDKGAVAEAHCTQALAQLAALDSDQRTFDNTVLAFEQSVMDYVDAINRLAILKDLHPEEAVRLAAAQVEERSGKYLVQLMARRDLYQALKSYSENRAAQEGLDTEQKRLLDLTLRDFRRNGLELDEPTQKRLVELQTRLVELTTLFQLNLNANESRIVVSDAELAGLPEAFVQRLKKAREGGWIVTCQYPDYFPFMENATSEDARRRLFIAFQSREADKNTPLLTEAISLRDQQAKLLGYETHADFVTEERMAKSSAAVKRFLSDLQTQLRPRRDADYARMTELKRAETNDPKATLQPWDIAYYLNQIKKRDWAIDSEAIREFFPIETVLTGLFGVYETLFGIEIVRVEGADTWADVPLYEIRDANGGGHVGNFYLDLYPRPGKYGHAAAAGVTVARQVGSDYRAPIAIMIGNFNPPSTERPSLLSHDEVETLFHEFGHIMHQTLTSARYGSLSGTSVARDFVEAPSQMLENWAFEKDVLDRMSGHFRDPTKKLPSETIEKLKAARSFDAGYRYTRQVFLATFDQVIHSSGPEVDVEAVDRQLYADILGLTPVAEAHFPATFGHLMGGYDAGYYGYLWSEVFADDMFTVFETNGVLNPAIGLRYRQSILEPGKMRDADELLREFLGREPNNTAFLSKIGIEK
ncbi:MAG: Zn-dependent oligopeptidase [Myxococcales bacterium]|jgi:thimet oligopeptidase|nr:Zn-dependent oligopeptidase [Myxococcales bacterium]